MASIFELKTDSQWIMVKTTLSKHNIFYSFKNKVGMLMINGTDKFFGAVPFEKGIGAVSIKNTKHKTVNVDWFIIDEQGKILETCKTYKAMQNYVKHLRNAENNLTI